MTMVIATMTTIFSGKGELPQQVQETPTIFLKMLGLMLLPGQSTMDNGHDEKPENIGNVNEIHKSAMTCLSFYCNTQPSIRIKLCTQDTTVNELS